jgi:hypothetical protein
VLGELGSGGHVRPGQGQPDEKLATRTSVPYSDLAGMRLDDAARDREAEPGAFGRLGSSRWLAVTSRRPANIATAKPPRWRWSSSPQRV